MPDAVSPSLYPSKEAFEAAFKVARKARIPQIPDIVLDLQRELATPDPDVRVICALVEKDIAIAGQLLKTINSPAFGARSSVGSVRQAVAILGVQRLATLVTAEAVTRLLANLDGAVQVIMESLMEEARATAAVARAAKVIGEDEAYLFGIMHDVGCLIFGASSPDYGTEWILRAHASPRSLLEYERTALGVDHPTLAFLLARLWHLPEHLALAAYHHHDLGYIEGEDQKVRSLIAILKLAHYLVALAHGAHETAEVVALRDDAWQELEISEQGWQSLCDQAQQGVWGESRA